MSGFTLLEILQNSDFRVSSSPRDVAEKITTFLSRLGTDVKTFKNCPVTKAASKLCAKYKARKVNKDRFILLERDWLANVTFAPVITMEEEPSQSAATECSFESIPLLPPPSLAEVRPSSGPVPSVSTGSILEMGAINFDGVSWDAGMTNLMANRLLYYSTLTI